MRSCRCLLVLFVLAGCAVETPAPAELPALSEAAQARRFAAWQQALEKNAGGESTTWSDRGGARGSIAPIDTVHSQTEGWCRDYEELIASGEARYRVVGIACRKPGPRWLVLDVRSFAE